MAGASAGSREEPGSEAADARLRQLVGYSMRLAFHRLRDGATRVLEGYGLRTRTFSALMIICDQPGLRQSQLAEVLHMERSNTVPLVDALQAAGYVERLQVPEDRRSYALRATAEGRRVCRAAVEALVAQEDEMLAGLSAAERAELVRLLGVVGAG